MTLRRGIGADPGDRTRTSAIPGPQAAVTSDQRWSEWRDSNPHLKAWKARRQPLPHIRPRWAGTPRPGPTWTGVVHRPIDVRRLSKTPLDRVGDSARIRTRTHEVWRLGCCRYTTLPITPVRKINRQTHPPCDLTRSLSAFQAKTKKAFQGIAPEGLFLDECRPFRALRLPRSRHRARRRRGSSTGDPWTGTRLPPDARWPETMASPSMRAANW